MTLFDCTLKQCYYLHKVGIEGEMRLETGLNINYFPGFTRTYGLWRDSVVR